MQAYGQQIRNEPTRVGVAGELTYPSTEAHVNPVTIHYSDATSI
jgi:hypothetical protein